MQTAYFINVLTCLATSVVSFLIYYRLRGVKKENPTLYYYGIIWLFLAAAIFLLGLSTLADWANNFKLQKKLFYLIEIISFASVLPTSLAVISILKNQFKVPSLLIKIYYYFLSLMLAGFLYALFTFGLAHKPTVFFGVTLSLNQPARIILSIMIAIPFLIATYLFIDRSFTKEQPPLNSHEKILIAGLYIFSLAALLAQSGLFQGWQIIFARIFLLLGALVSFLALYDAKNKLDLLK